MTGSCLSDRSGTFKIYVYDGIFCIHMHWHCDFPDVMTVRSNCADLRHSSRPWAERSTDIISIKGSSFGPFAPVRLVALASGRVCVAGTSIGLSRDSGDCCIPRARFAVTHDSIRTRSYHNSSESISWHRGLSAGVGIEGT